MKKRSATSVKNFTSEEKATIKRYVADLSNEELREFLRENERPVSGAKDVLLERIDQLLATRAIDYGHLIDLIDTVTPWSAQHVFMLQGPERGLDSFLSKDAFEKHLKTHRASSPLRERKKLALPDELTVVEIQHDGKRIRVTAVEKREGAYRDADYDSSAVTEEGAEVELRAYVHEVARGLVVFEWSVAERTANVHITQLPSMWDYEEAYERFADCTSSWLPLGDFDPINLRAAIPKMHDDEKAKIGGIRSHGLEYETKQGRRLSGKSASATDSVLGEAVIDNAMHNMRTAGMGRNGNFYFDLSQLKDATREEAHVIIVANAGRVNFPTSNGEEAVRYVLSRIRSYCG